MDIFNCMFLVSPVWKYHFQKALGVLSASFSHSLIMASAVLSTTPARCRLFSFFCSCPTALHSLFRFDAHFLELLLLCLPCFYSFFSLSPLPFSGAPFSLSSSASFPPLALTRGYSFLGWAETASLYNTDRLLCNQIPSVATSEDSLSHFLHHTHTHTRKRVGTHMHAHTHITSVPPTPEQCACAVFMYNDPCTYNRSTWFILGLQGGSHRSHFHHFLFFSPTQLSHRVGGWGVGVQRSLSSGISMFVLWLCVSARPWLLYQTGDSGL